MKQKNSKFNFKDAIEFYKSKKAFFFFGFYLFFFIFLFFFMSGLDSEPNNNIVSTDNEYQTVYKFNSLNNNNYNYLYQIIENKSIQEISGVKDDNNINITNYQYNKLLNTNYLKQIIKNSKYISKTEYANGTYALNYEILNKDLALLLDNESDDVNSNKIILYTDNIYDIYKIELDITSYISSIQEGIDNYKIVLSFTW